MITKPLASSEDLIKLLGDYIHWCEDKTDHGYIDYWGNRIHAKIVEPSLVGFYQWLLTSSH